MFEGSLQEVESSSNFTNDILELYNRTLISNKYLYNNDKKVDLDSISQNNEYKDEGKKI